jgi:O-antigen ligase
MTTAGDWPRTNRLLPWLLAFFLCVLWLVPYEAIQLSVPLPIDPLPDRFILIGIVVAMLASVFAIRAVKVSRPASGFWQALLVFAVVALVSLGINAVSAASLGEIDQGTKKVVLLFGNLALFYVVATVIRPTELRAFGILIIALATLAAAGTIWEYRTDYNVFYDLAAKAFGGVASVAPVPGVTIDGREDTFGPTAHGLAITTMLAFALPFAVLELLRSPTRRRKLLFAIAVGIILTGGLATLRKTSLIAPVAALLTLIAYRPRHMLRLVPLAAVLLVTVHFMAPGALGGVSSQITGDFFGSGTTVGRTSDYEAVQPELATHPIAGRGYGTPDVSRSDTYRILDNQYLAQLVQVGVVGLAVYLALVLAGVLLAHDVIRRARDEDRRTVGLAAAAGFVAFAVASALFDLFSFSQAPYMFMFVAGLCSVAATSPAPSPAPAHPPVLEPVPAV